jgi:hypothetical protein
MIASFGPATDPPNRSDMDAPPTGTVGWCCESCGRWIFVLGTTANVEGGRLFAAPDARRAGRMLSEDHPSHPGVINVDSVEHAGQDASGARTPVRRDCFFQSNILRRENQRYDI